MAADLGRADVLVGNLESVLLSHPYSPLGGKAKLISSTVAVESLKSAGFDVLTFANNHIMDAGQEGFLECLRAIREAGFQVTGAGADLADARRPAWVEAGGLSFKFFAYSYALGQTAGSRQAGCCEARLDRILDDVAEFSRPGDIRVVTLHMDAEFQETPAPDRIALCRTLAESGVQAILCHHPHVPQGVEVHHGAVIAYSLGNFVFPMSSYMLENSPDNARSFHLHIDFNDDGPVRVRIEPVLIDAAGRPLPAEGREREDLLELVRQRSELLQDPQAVRTRYRDMTGKFTRQVFKDIYWAIGERDWQKVRLFLASFRITPTKRKWVLHHLTGSIREGLTAPFRRE